MHVFGLEWHKFRMEWDPSSHIHSQVYPQNAVSRGHFLGFFTSLRIDSTRYIPDFFSMSLLGAGVQCNKCLKEPNIAIGLRCAANRKRGGALWCVTRAHISLFFRRFLDRAADTRCLYATFSVSGTQPSKCCIFPSEWISHRAPHVYRCIRSSIPGWEISHNEVE